MHLGYILPTKWHYTNSSDTFKDLRVYSNNIPSSGLVVEGKVVKIIPWATWLQTKGPENEWCEQDVSGRPPGGAWCGNTDQCPGGPCTTVPRGHLVTLIPPSPHSSTNILVAVSIFSTNSNNMWRIYTLLLYIQNGHLLTEEYNNHESPALKISRYWWHVTAEILSICSVAIKLLLESNYLGH